MDNVNEARAAQDIRDSAAFVVRQLTAKYPEVHLKRALAIELQARGFLAHAEAQIPTWYRASDGRVHAICNDRVDILAIRDGVRILIECKKGQATQSALSTGHLQLERYANNCRTNGINIHFRVLVFFDPNGLVVDFKYDIPPPQMRFAP